MSAPSADALHMAACALQDWMGAHSDASPEEVEAVQVVRMWLLGLWIDGVFP